MNPLNRSTQSTRSVVIHAEATWFQAIRQGKFDFFTKLDAKLISEGFSTQLVDADSRASRLLMAEDSLHIMVGERAAYGPKILHAMPTYIWGFWYLDEVGVHWNSSLRFARFAPESIDADKATYFFNGVSGPMLRENVSKFPQESRTQTLKPAKAVIFAQEIEAYKNRCHYLTTEQMIHVTAEGQRDHFVYVKLHPNQSPTMRGTILRACQAYSNVIISDASIHDLIAASEFVITQNSAAGFEALMQKKPVITCAKSDYWHATLTAKTADDLREALEFGKQAVADFPFDKYFYWFLDRNCLEPQKEVFANRAFARIRDKLMLVD
jgi:hypothetical protein